MKAVEIINRALNVSGILARTLEAEDDEEGVDGLFWLNRLLEEKSATGKQLPYYGHISLTAIPGQESYFVTGLVNADVLTFTLQNVRYSVRPENRNRYFGSSRAENIVSLPYKWYWERVNGGLNVYLYFFPADAYDIQITGLATLQTNIDFDTDLDGFVDRFYQNFLIYELAETLCIYYKISLPPATMQKLVKLKKEMTYINLPDLSIVKRSLLGGDGTISYAQVNIGKGWAP